MYQNKMYMCVYKYFILFKPSKRLFRVCFESPKFYSVHAVVSLWSVDDERRMLVLKIFFSKMLTGLLLNFVSVCVVVKFELFLSLQVCSS